MKSFCFLVALVLAGLTHAGNAWAQTQMQAMDEIMVATSMYQFANMASMSAAPPMDCNMLLQQINGAVTNDPQTATIAATALEVKLDADYEFTQMSSFLRDGNTKLATAGQQLGAAQIAFNGGNFALAIQQAKDSYETGLASYQNFQSAAGEVILIDDYYMYMSELLMQIQMIAMNGMMNNPPMEMPPLIAP